MFYKETRFRQTEVGEIPENWDIQTLDNICERIKAGGTPLTSKREYWNGEIPFVKIEDITSVGKYLTSTSSFITKEGLANSSAWIIPENSLLLAMYGSLGEVSINKVPVASNQAILGIVPKHGEDVEFLYYWYLLFKPKWRRYAKPTTQANLTAEIVKNSKIPYPPLEERLAISHVLSTMDQAIQKTQQIVSKLQRLKQGLMQHLLTKGIGHKEFKDTEIGRIPREWEIVRLGDIAEINRESKNPTKEAPNQTFLYIDIESVEGGTGKIRKSKRILGRNAPSRARRVVHENDVIMSTVRPYLKAFAIVPKEYDGQICSTGFAVLSCKNVILPYFLLNVLFLDNIIAQCNAMMVGGQYPALTQSHVSSLKVPLPPLPEQRRITKILSIIDKKLESERNEKAKLERIKQGLMDLLLTGKVRVRLDQ